MTEDILTGKTHEDIIKILKDKKSEYPNKEFLRSVLMLHPDEFDRARQSLAMLGFLRKPLNMDEELKKFFMPTYKPSLQFFQLDKLMAMLYLFKLAGVDGGHFDIKIREQEDQSSDGSLRKFTIYEIIRKYRHE